MRPFSSLICTLWPLWILYDNQTHFGPRILPRGSLVIALVRWSVRWSVRPSLNISETVHWFFLIFCMKLEYHKGTKVTEPDFWKKILGGHKWGKTPILGAFLCFLSISLHPVIEIFRNFIYMISSTLSDKVNDGQSHQFSDYHMSICSSLYFWPN